MSIKLYNGDCLEIMKDIPDGGVACVHTDRSFIGIELDENYFNLAKERIENEEQTMRKRLF